MRNFLSICGPIHHTGGVSTGTVDFTRYADWQMSNPAFLLVEGINQFCVRVGRNVLGGNGSVMPRILPVAIKRLEVGAMALSTSYRIEGKGVAFGNTTRVTISVTPILENHIATDEGSASAMRAEIIVAALQLDECSNAA